MRVDLLESSAALPIATACQIATYVLDIVSKMTFLAGKTAHSCLLSISFVCLMNRKRKACRIQLLDYIWVVCRGKFYAVVPSTT